jgi:hypothetical protein
MRLSRSRRLIDLWASTLDCLLQKMSTTTIIGANYYGWEGRMKMQHTLSRLILTKILRHFIERNTLAQLGQRLLFFAVFLAQDVAHIDRRSRLQFALPARLGTGSCVFSFSFVLWRHRCCCGMERVCGGGRNADLV